MMFIHGIDNNILNSGALFFGVYQENERDLTIGKYFWGVGTKPIKTDKTVVHVSLSTLVIFLN